MKKLTLILFLPLFFMAVTFCKAENSGNRDVKKAFELRLSGKVDEAKALLKDILGKDSTNAMAHYEMARLNFYLLTGGGGIRMEDVIDPITKAVALEPENITYAYYRAVTGFMNAFMQMQMGKEDKVKDALEETCSLFKKVLILKPDYCEPMLYLVEIYGQLPKEMGGDSATAAFFAGKLASIDDYFGARAREVLLPEGADVVKFWEKEMAMHGRTPELLTRAGIASLFKDDSELAEKYFDEAMKSDPAMNILMLQLGRYHMMKVMNNRELADTELPIAAAWFEKYLESDPEPIVPLRAYTLGLLARNAMFSGKQEEGKKLMEEANTLDKYFSKASGVPNLLLFEPLDKVCHHYFSFFSPF